MWPTGATTSWKWSCASCARVDPGKTRRVKTNQSVQNPGQETNPMLQSVLDRFCRLLSLVMVASLFLMVVMVFGNVVLRYGFNTGITVSEELSRWLFVWMTF